MRLCVLGAFFLAGCVTPTEVVVHFDAADDARSSADRLTVTVTSLVSESAATPGVVREIPVGELPTSITVTPRVTDSDRRFKVVARLVDAAGNSLSRREIQSGFVEHERRALYVLLDVGADSGLSCTDRQTWNGEGCVGSCVTEPELPREPAGRPTETGPCDFSCVDAEPGLACTEAGRSGRCWNGSCCLGCFDGIACRPGRTVDACGHGGEACSTCVASPPCGDTCRAEPGTTAFACEPEIVAHSLAVGDHHTCASSSGGVFCFGRNDDGQLGDGTTTATHVPRLVRGPLASLTAGQAFTCGINQQSRLVCWGDREKAQLGDGLGSDRMTAPNDADVNTTDAQQFQSVSAGRDHACAIDVEGQVFCWGQNSVQQAGQPQSVNVELDRTVVGAGIEFAVVDAGSKHTCGIDTDGTLYCWGGCCGAVQERNPELATIVPSTTERLDGGPGVDGGVEHVAWVPREAAMGFRTVSAGRFGTCAIDDTSSPWCSGFAKHSIPEFSGSELLPLWELPETYRPARAAVQGHWDRICILREDLSVACADEDTWVDSADTTQTLLPLHSRWVSVDSGRNHLCAIRAGGALYCWGAEGGDARFADNDFGQIGVQDPELGVLYRVCLPPR